MAATATARNAGARRAASRKPARSTPPRRSSAPRRQTPVVGFVPVAVGRTADAVGGLADSGLVVRLTRSRLWIGLLGGLLIGIVALNVIALSFSASSSEAARQADELERLNSALRGDIATRLSSDEVEAAASRMGMFIPEPGAIRYLRGSSADAAEAARRLRDGELGSGYIAPESIAAPVETAPTAPVQTPVAEEVAPVAEEAAAPAPAVAPESAAATVPAAPAAPAAPAGGGVAAP
jgi:hypothetical protein